MLTITWAFSKSYSFWNSRYQRPLITDQHNKYNNNEKVWTIVSVSTMRHRDREWANSTGRLAWRRVATNLQFVKKKKKCSTWEARWVMPIPASSPRFCMGDGPTWCFKDQLLGIPVFKCTVWMHVVNCGHDPHVHIGPLTCDISHCTRKGQVETPETTSSKTREQRKTF